jgi:hypothetical protein
MIAAHKLRILLPLLGKAGGRHVAAPDLTENRFTINVPAAQQNPATRNKMFTGLLWIAFGDA